MTAFFRLLSPSLNVGCVDTVKHSETQSHEEISRIHQKWPRFLFFSSGSNAWYVNCCCFQNFRSPKNCEFKSNSTGCLFTAPAVRHATWMPLHSKMHPTTADWWFQTCFMFHFIYGMSSQPHWLINSFQDGYSTWLFAFPALRKLDTNRHTSWKLIALCIHSMSHACDDAVSIQVREREGKKNSRCGNKETDRNRRT